MGKKDAAAAGSHSNGANGVSNGKKGAKSENGKTSRSVTHNDADNGNQVRHVKLQHPNGITDDLDHTKPLASPWPRIVSLIVITVGLRFALSQVIAPIVAPQGDAAISAVSIATRVVEVIGAISIILRVIEAVLLGIILGNAKGAHHDPAYDEQKGWTFQNWSQIHTFHPKTVEYPANLEELKAIVTKHGRAGRHIKPAGALHSWSACAVTDDVSLVTGRLNRVLSVDKAKKLVTAEAGIRLRDLYASIDKQGLAFATLPNVDIILLGGAVSNATHGTNFDVGTFSSQITEMQMVIFRSKPGRPQSEGEAELVTISKSDNGKEGRRWLEAAVASFGSLGVIYSITMQCCDPYVAYVREFGVTQAEMQGRVLEMIRAYPAMQVQVWTKPESVNYVCKIQNRFSGALIKPDTKLLWTDGDLFTVKLLFFAFQPNAKTYLWLRKLIGTFYNALTSQTNLMTQTLKRRDVAGVMHWSDAELVSRFVAVVSTSPWTNLEYAIPADKIDLACERLNAVMRKHPSLGTYSIRPVGADEIGYLSPTYGRPTCYIDVPYFKDLDEKGSYAEVEKALLDLGGRCSWSRLFKAKTSDVIAQFPRAKEFVQVKNEMDPFNVFSNQFSDSILFPQKK